jgi:hypothetical protein
VTVPEIDNGDGEILLPAGFEYEMFASVSCNEGSKILSRESKPYQIMKIEYGAEQVKATFEINGPICQIWKP